ncbi:MAG: hypothetical protein ACK5RE_01895 [Pseudanabaena sp.]
MSTAKGQNLFMGMNRVYVMEVQIYTRGARDSIHLVGKPERLADLSNMML